MTNIKPSCIYCNNIRADFKKKAHVLSQFMGNFSPDIYIEGDIVCDDCNKALGDTIEKHFSDKSFEGLIARFHLRRKQSKQSPIILYESSLLNFEFSSETPLGYNSLLSLVSAALEKIGVVKDPLLILKKKGLHAFIFAEDVAKLTSENALKSLKFKIKDFRKDAESGEWIGNREDSAEIVQTALKKLGLKANFEKEQVNDNPQKIKTKFAAVQNVDVDSARFVAKVAFEFFAYCATKSGSREQVFAPEFKPIREFIKDGKGDAKKIVSVISNNFMAPSAKQGNNHYFIAFEVVKGHLVAQVAFMDSIAYQILLGKSPFLIANPRIGNAHAFNVTTKGVRRMYNSKHPPIISTNEFSIYNK